MSQLIVIETIHAVSGKFEDLKQALLKIVPFAIKEKGCLHYEITEPEHLKNELMILMRWENKELYNKHSQADHIQEFVKKYNNILFDGYQENFWITC